MNIDSLGLWATLSARQCDADIRYVHLEIVNGGLLWWSFVGETLLVQIRDVRLT
jgi:hypothetical protein